METQSYRNELNRNQVAVDWTSPSGRTLVAIGLWMRAAFVGACALLSGLLMLIHGESGIAIALALAVGGSLLSVFGWQHTKVLLDRLDTTDGIEANPLPKSGNVTPATAMPRRQTRLAIE